MIKTFNHVNATTVNEAAGILAEGKAKVIAGGTSLLVVMRHEMLPEYPEVLVNIKTIPGLDSVKEEGGMLKIGALATLSDIEKSPLVRDKYASLAEAAGKVSGPQVRNMGTIGGNICQHVQCWYYKAKNNYFYCLRKGGTVCQAIPGDNRYLAILGWELCPAVCPSDTAIPLAALNATIVTNKRSIPIGDFFDELGSALGADEIVTEIQVPTPPAGSKQAFVKASIRKAVDFALASAAVLITPATGSVTSARVVLGAVAPTPWRATKAEEALVGKTISEAVAETAAAAAVDGASTLSHNTYLIQMAKGVVKRAILA